MNVNPKRLFNWGGTPSVAMAITICGNHHNFPQPGSITPGLTLIAGFSKWGVPPVIIHFGYPHDYGTPQLGHSMLISPAGHPKVTRFGPTAAVPQDGGQSRGRDSGGFSTGGGGVQCKQ